MQVGAIRLRRTALRYSPTPAGRLTPYDAGVVNAADNKTSESGLAGFKDYQDWAALAPAHGEPVEPPNPVNPQIPKILILTTVCRRTVRIRICRIQGLAGLGPSLQRPPQPPLTPRGGFQHPPPRIYLGIRPPLRVGKVNPHRVVVAGRVPGPARRLLVVRVPDAPATVGRVGAFALGGRRQGLIGRE